MGMPAEGKLFVFEAAPSFRHECATSPGAGATRRTPNPEPSRQLGYFLDIGRDPYSKRVSIAPQVTF